MKINHNPDQTTYSIVFFTPPSKKKQKIINPFCFVNFWVVFLVRVFYSYPYMELLTLSYLQKIIYYAFFHANASLRRGYSVRRRQSTGGSVAIPRPGGRQRTRKYTIMNDVLFVVS